MELEKLWLSNKTFIVVIKGSDHLGKLLKDYDDNYIESKIPTLTAPFISENGVCDNISRMNYKTKEWIRNLSAKDSLLTLLNNVDIENDYLVFGRV